MSVPKPKPTKPPLQPTVPAPEPVMTEEMARQASELQAARDGLYQTLAQYRALLKDTTLAENRSKQQRDSETQVLQQLNAQNGVLEQINAGEGPLALVFTALNSLLAMRDKLNDLRYQNSMMYKELKELRGTQTDKPAGTGA